MGRARLEALPSGVDPDGVAIEGAEDVVHVRHQQHAEGQAQQQPRELRNMPNCHQATKHTVSVNHTMGEFTRSALVLEDQKPTTSLTTLNELTVSATLGTGWPEERR